MTVVISRFISYSIFIPKKWIIIFLKFRFYFSKVFFSFLSILIVTLSQKFVVDRATY